MASFCPLLFFHKHLHGSLLLSGFREIKVIWFGCSDITITQPAKVVLELVLNAKLGSV